MANKTELPACPVETTLMLSGDKWKVLILRDLRSGTKRFGEWTNGELVTKCKMVNIREYL